MRVLVVSQYFWPENFRINDLVAELTTRGHAVTVLTGVPNYPDGEVFEDYAANPRRFDEYAGARVVRVPMFARHRGGLRLMLNYVSFALSAATVGAWRLRGTPFDVIFVFEPSPVTVGLPAVWLKYLKRAPIAFWVLDQWPETLQAIGVVRSERLLRLVGRMVSFIYRRCDLLLAQSASFVSKIRRYAGDRCAVEYFPSWSDTEPVRDRVAADAAVPPMPGVFTIVFAGNIGDAQDFPSILDAAELLRHRSDVRWIIVGDGRRAEWVAQEIRRRDLGSRMSMLGRFPLERMPGFFASADALLVSLKPEPVFALTIPGKMQSYLAAGKPVLAMLNGEGADLIRRSGAGIACNAGDGAGLAACVERMIAMSPADRAGMAAAAARLSAEEFDRGRLIDRLEGLLAGMKA
jgi:colanic acid biosynthesis glycosyl transferase WcaI